MSSLPRSLPAALALASALVGGVTGCERRAEPGIDRTPAPLPEGWGYELAVGGDAALAALRARLPEGPARAALPSRIADVADALVMFPDALREHVAEGSPLRCVALAAGERARAACALRVRALPSSIERAGGAPRGARWLPGLAPSEGAVALAGDVVVVGEDRETVEQALPWLVFTAMAEPPVRGVRARLADDAGPSALRSIAEGLIERHARALREEAAAERARHDEPPALGEPEALVEAVTGSLRERAALLSDLGAIEVDLAPVPNGLELHARARVREGSPLAHRLAVIPEGPAFGLASLPADTVLAWTARAGSQELAALPDDAIAVLAPIAGARLGNADRAALRDALQAWASARGEAAVAAIGVSGPRPWALVASRPARNVLLTPFEAALRTSWASRIAERMWGCSTVLDPDVRVESGRPGSPETSDARRLCEPLRVARGYAADVLVIAVEASSAPERETARDVAEAIAAQSAVFGAAPDVERALEALPEHVLGAAILVPARVPALLATLAPALRDRGPAPPTGAPVAIALARQNGALVVRAVAGREALAALVALLGLWAGS
jgi:hypothetical protein